MMRIVCPMEEDLSRIAVLLEPVEVLQRLIRGFGLRSTCWLLTPGGVCRGALYGDRRLILTDSRGIKDPGRRG